MLHEFPLFQGKTEATSLNPGFNSHPAFCGHSARFLNVVHASRAARPVLGFVAQSRLKLRELPAVTGIFNRP